MAEMARTHNNADILVLASDFTSNQKAEKICNVFLKTKFSKASRHVRRLNKVRKLEE
jgi:ribose 5-phosphate isomerase RpiB